VGFYKFEDNTLFLCVNETERPTGLSPRLGRRALPGRARRHRPRARARRNAQSGAPKGRLRPLPKILGYSAFEEQHSDAGSSWVLQQFNGQHSGHGSVSPVRGQV
jgi:hypothetical protein